MATKKIQIEFDLNTNEVKLAGEATMSLAQQVRILQKELSKTPEGTKEFELLRRKLNDTKDNFDRVNAKSRELFGTLSLIPGPVGEIAGKLNGAISLMKTFSGFSFKDLGNQFKGLIDDIKGIFANLGGLGDITKNVSNSQKELSKTTNTVVKDTAMMSSQVLDAGASIQSMQQSQIAATAAQKTATLVTQQQTIASQIATLQMQKNIVAEKMLTGELSKYVAEAEMANIQTKINTLQTQQSTTATAANTVVQAENTVAQEGAAAGATTNALANEALAVAETKAAVAGRILRGVLASLGIGAIIVLVGMVVGKFMELIDAMKDAKDNTDDLNASLERQKKLLDDITSGIDTQTQIEIERAKQAGKGEADIFEIRKKGLEKQLVATREATNKIAATEAEARAATGRFAEMSDEKRIEQINIFNKEKQTLFDKEIQLTRQIELEGERERTRIAEEGRNKRKKKKEDSDKDDNSKLKAQLDAQIQLEINSENTRLDVLEGLLEKRFKLEKGSAAELELLYRENQKKVLDAINEDNEKKRQAKLKAIDSEIEIEESQAKVSTENLIQLLTQKRDLELQALDLTEKEKLAIIAKYESDFRKLRQDAREKELVESIQAAQGNFDRQIELYRQFANEVITSTNYTEGEKLRIIQETNDKIEQLQQQRLDDEKNKLDLSLQNSELSYTEYFDALDTIYEKEIERYKKLYANKEITEAQYNANIKKLTDARISIRQQELEAQIKTFQAIGEGLNAVASILGEQTKAGKALAVAASLINTYAAIAGQLKAFSGIPIPGYAIAQAIATGLVGFANVRKIIQTQIPNVSTSSPQFSSGMINVNQRRAQGGFITGPGGDTSDNVPAMLSNGEFVINSRSTRVFRPLLETINSASNLPAFAAGGLVRESMGSTPFKSQNETIADAISTAFGQTPIKTYVTATDVSTQQQFERVIKSRSLI